MPAVALSGGMLGLQDFVAAYSGRYVNPWHNPYGAQCVDLVNEWCANLGIELFPGNAGTFAYDAHPDCDLIYNSPHAVPAPGDIVIWRAGGVLGLPFGHVDIFLGGDGGGFTGFDQNWPEGSPAHEQQHNYYDVGWWFHPRGFQWSGWGRGSSRGVAGGDSPDARGAWDRWGALIMRDLPDHANSIGMASAWVDGVTRG